jgi:Zn-dependent protease with chaperone function
MTKININLWKFLLLASVLGSVMVLVLQKSLPILFHKSVYYCQSFLQGVNIQVPPFLHVALGLFFTVFALMILARLTFVLFKTIFFRRGLTLVVTKNKNLIALEQKLKLDKKIRVFKNEKPYAFCLGINNPKIYLSTATIKIMGKAELEAILLHERYHLHKKDTFVMFLATLSKLAFPFFPLLSDLVNSYSIDREIRADKEAIKNVGSEALISVLKKFLNFPSLPMVTASAIADCNTLEPRIRVLVGEKIIHKKYNKFNAVLSIAFTLLFVFFVVAPVQATEIHSKNVDTMMICLNDQKCADLCKKYGIGNTKDPKEFTQEVNMDGPYTPVK